MTPLQKNLKALIEERALSVAEIERQSDLKNGTLRSILLGKSVNPRVDVLDKLARFFDCDIYCLIDPAGKKSNSSLNEKANLKILSEFGNLIKEKCEKEDLKIPLSRFYEIQKECYKYSTQNDLQRLDENFLNWSIQKEKDNQC